MATDKFRLQGKISPSTATDSDLIEVTTSDHLWSVTHVRTGPQMPINREPQYTLYPLSMRLFWPDVRHHEEAQIAFTISGNQCGVRTQGPLGHPGDGEYDQWTISSFGITCTFRPDGAQFDIAGQTAPGRSGFYTYTGPGTDKHREPLPHIAFSISFRLDLLELKAFLRCTDMHFDRIKDLLRRLGAA